MSVAYDAWLAQSALDVVVLVEVQPMEPLAVWTAAGGGLTNTYYASFATQVQTTVVPGGLYRRLDVVRQNGTALTSRASAALVNANLGSYFHDTATSRIYVSTQSGANPNTAALIGAWFTLFFSTAAVSYAAQPLYAPLVTGTLPTVSAVMPESLFGAIVSSAGTLALLNGDGLFDRLAKQFEWRNKKVTFRLGGASLAWADYAVIVTMRINGVDVDDDVATLQLEDMGSILNRTLPLVAWGDGVFTPLALPAESVLGQLQPLVFGTVHKCPMVRGNRVGGTVDIWYAYDLAHNDPVVFANVIAVDRVTREQTLLVENVDYTVTAFTSVNVSNPAYLYETHDIICAMGSLGPYRFGSIVVVILGLCGEDPANIDTAAFAAADLTMPYILGRFIGQPVSAIDLVRELEQSVGGQVYLGADGRWTCRAIDDSLPADAVALRDEDFASWHPSGELVGALNEVRVRYGHQPAFDEWFERSSSDDTVQYARETTDSHRIATWIVSSADAYAVAQHLRFAHAAPPARFAFEERGLTLMTASVGDLVRVTRARGPVARTGRYDGQLLRLIALDKHLGPETPRVTGVLDDLSGQTDRVARYAGLAPTMTWATATDEERAIYGFYSDANGYLDAADPLTRHAKVYV